MKPATARVYDQRIAEAFLFPCPRSPVTMSIRPLLLACVCLALIPWSLASAWRGRYWFIRSAERALTWAVALFVTLVLVRWFLVVGTAWHAGSRL